MAKAKGRRAKAAKRSNSPSGKKAGGGRQAAARSGAGPARKGVKNTGRRTSGAKTPRGKARKRATTARASAAGRSTGQRAAPKRSNAQRVSAKRGSAKAEPSRKRSTTGKAAPASPKRSTNAKRAPASPKRSKAAKVGGTGRERDLAQTPETGRTVRGRTNPMRTIRSTGSPAGAGDSRHVPALQRERRQLREVEESIPEPPSSLNMDRKASAARTGRAEMRQARREHTETSPALTGGDVDADWEDAYAVGDEAPGGDNPTPDQDVVDDIGRSLGVEYQDNEELKPVDKIAKRDKHRWELDPASSEDYREHEK
jgi:hypothetical protein